MHDKHTNILKNLSFSSSSNPLSPVLPHASVPLVRIPLLPPEMSSSSASTGAQINSTIDATLPPAVAHKIPHLPETKEQLKADVEVVKEKSFAGLRSLAAGGFGGVCAVVVGHPFDLVKVRLQTAERGVYTGAFDVVRKSVAKNGLGRGLYAGVSAPLVGVTPMCTFLPYWNSS